MFEPNLSLNKKFIEWAREEYDDGEINIHEYEERLDAYMVDDMPKRIRPRDMMRCAKTFVKSEDEMNFFGYVYTIEDGWYVRKDE